MQSLLHRIRSRHVLACSFACLLSAGCSSSDHDHDDHAHDTGIDQVWPPQLTGMTNQVALPPSARTRARNTVLSAARSSLLNNPAVRQAIGQEVVEFEGSLGDPKGDLTASFLFYNYETDQSVTAELLRDGSIGVDTKAAAEFQPAEHPDEVTSAIDLARTALEDGGFDTSGLQGTAMLAFPRRSDVSSLETTFYPQRMLYVTFGPGEGELPDYSALVNLSTSTVTETVLVR